VQDIVIILQPITKRKDNTSLDK